MSVSLVIPFFNGTDIEETFEFFFECNNLYIASIASNLIAICKCKGLNLPKLCGLWRFLAAFHACEMQPMSNLTSALTEICFFKHSPKLHTKLKSDIQMITPEHSMSQFIIMRNRAYTLGGSSQPPGSIL